MPYKFEDLAYLESYGWCSYANVCATLASTECVSMLEPSNLLQLVCALGRVCFCHCHTAAWRTYEVHTGQDGSYGCRADPARRGEELLCRLPALKSEAWLKGVSHSTQRRLIHFSCPLVSQTDRLDRPLARLAVLDTMGCRAPLHRTHLRCFP